jgi:hypothetical protein
MIRHARTRGNILIYILGAIFLIGLLVMLMRGSFQEGSGIDPERNALLATQVQKYGADLERGVRNALQNGYSETELRFSHPNAPSSYGLISSIPQRQVFASEGGGVEWKAPPTGVQATSAPWMFVARNAVTQVGSTCAAAGCTDLIAVLPTVTRDFCLEINKLAGVTNPSGNPPREVDALSLSPLFTAGTFGYDQALNTTGGHTNARLEGCIEGNGGDAPLGSYYYYRVLLAR